MAHVRWMIRRDVPEVLAIEQGSFAQPWTEDELVAHLRHRRSIGQVGEDGNGAVLGYFVYVLHPDHLNLACLAVHPSWRRRGIGSLMLDKLVAKLSPHRRSCVACAVDERDLGAHLFLRACCFRATGVIRGRDGDPDEYLFERKVAVSVTASTGGTYGT